MPNANNSNKEFLNKATQIVEEKLSDEFFGVSELAKEMGISRSYLHRKIISITKTSVSQFIRQIRLEKARALLRNTSSTVSEVAYNVGFSSVTYFSKCFHDYYGYSPGEVGNREEENVHDPVQHSKVKKKSLTMARLSGLVIIVTVSAVFIYFFAGLDKPENTIAVMPFQDYSASANDQDVINGLGYSLYNHLSVISGLSMPGYSSVLKYKTDIKPPNEIGKELGVNFIVDANGFKIANKLALHVNLYETSTNRLIWKDKYERDLDDILTLESEIVQEIVKKLKINLSEQEEKQIAKLKTVNPSANEHYLKGINQLSKANYDYVCNYQDTTLICHIDSAITEFNKAIKYDPRFSYAYVQKAKIFSYQFMKDQLKNDDSITKYTDLAEIYDSHIADYYISKAYVYEKEKDLDLAIRYLDKALEIYPNSAEAVGRLAHIYGFKLRIPDEFAYYATLNHKLNIDDNLSDITGRAMNYVAGIALQRMGLYKYVEYYLDKSLLFHPDAFTSVISIAHNKIYMGKNEEAIAYFKEYLEKHADHHAHYFGDLYGDMANLYLMTGDYNNAAKSFEKLKELTDSIDPRYLFSYVFVKRKELDKDDFITHLEKYKQFQLTRYNPNKNIDKDRHLNLFRVHCLLGDTTKAMEYFRIMADEEIPELHIINEFIHSPFYENLKENEEFKRMREELKNDFEAKRQEVLKLLQKEKLLPAIPNKNEIEKKEDEYSIVSTYFE